MKRLLFFIVSVFLTFIIINIVHAGVVVYANSSNAGCSDSFTRVEAMNTSKPWCNATTVTTDKLLAGDTMYIYGGVSRNKLKVANKNYDNKTTIICGDGQKLTRADFKFEKPSGSTWTNISWKNSTYRMNMWVASYSTYDSVSPSQDCVFGWYNDTKIDLYATCMGFTVCQNPTCTSSPAETQAWFNSSYVETDALWYNKTNSKLYIKFADKNKNPNSISLVIGNSYPVEINNITATGGMGNGLEIRNCNIEGFYSAVYIQGTSSNVTLTNNTIHQQYRGFDCGGDSAFLNITFNHIYANPMSNWTWEQKHDTPQENFGLGGYSCRGNVTFLNNTVHDMFNGITPGFSQSSAMDVLDWRGLEIGYNTIYNTLDDAIEPEPYANCFNVHHNFIHDVHVGMTMTPSNSSVCNSTFSYNIVIANSSVTGTVRTFKFSANEDNKTRGWTIDHNTLIGRDGIIQSTATKEIMWGVTWTNNIFYDNDNTSRLIDRTGTVGQNNYYDYNNYYKPGGVYFKYYASDTNNTEYNSLAAARASGRAPLWDLHSVDADPGLDMHTFQPYYNASACQASSTGSYVGAVACASINEIGTVTFGESGGSYAYPLSFPQKPYLLSANITVSMYNATMNLTKTVPDSASYTGLIHNPGNAYDGSMDSFAYSRDDPVGDNVILMYHGFNSSNIMIESKFSINANNPNTARLYLYCMNMNTFTYDTTLYSYTTTTAMTTRYDMLPSQCIGTNGDATLKYYLYTAGVSDYINLYDTSLTAQGNLTLALGDFDTGGAIIYSTNDNVSIITMDIAAEMNSLMTDGTAYLIVSHPYAAVFNFSFTSSEVYNVTQNFSIVDYRTGTPLGGVACDYNTQTDLDPRVSLFYFDSSKSNVLSCTKTSYQTLTYQVGYPYTAYNLTMQSQSVQLNFSQSVTGHMDYKNEVTVPFTTTFLEVNYTDLSSPIARIYFNYNDTQQVALWTDDVRNSNYYREVFVYTTTDLKAKKFRVTDGLQNVKYATVEAYINSTSKNLVYSSLTDADGYATLMLDSHFTYFICPYKTGYNTTDQACRHIGYGEWLSDDAIVLSLQEDVTYPDMMNMTPDHITVNPAGYRINMTITTAMFHSRTDRIVGIFLAVVIALIMMIIFEARIAGSGNIAFTGTLLMFAAIFNVFFVIVMVYGVYLVYRMFRVRT